MTWETLAPWIAIAFTLALSILVPLFTQIANNNHQRKMQQEKFEREEKQKKKLAYEEFLITVGAVIAHPTKENLPLAGSNIQRLYVYAPQSWWHHMDVLYDELQQSEWSDAAVSLKALNRLIAEEINKEQEST